MQIRCSSYATSPGRRRRERGMTLVEIMVVLVIMSLVAGVVGVAVFAALVDAEVDVAGVQIGQLRDTLAQYRLRHRRYPSSGDGLRVLAESPDGREPLMPSIPADPWGNPYQYVHPGVRNPHSFDLWSMGPDEVSGTADDIGNWSPPAEPAGR